MVQLSFYLHIYHLRPTASGLALATRDSKLIPAVAVLSKTVASPKLGFHCTSLHSRWWPHVTNLLWACGEFSNML